jgi:hypothetical protein
MSKHVPSWVNSRKAQLDGRIERSIEMLKNLPPSRQGRHCKVCYGYNMTFEERPFKNAGERAKIVERAKTASAWSPWYSRKNALGVSGGAASAGRTAAPPQGWGDLAVARDYGIHLLPVVEVVAWDDVKARLIMGLG